MTTLFDLSPIEPPCHILIPRALTLATALSINHETTTFIMLLNTAKLVRGGVGWLTSCWNGLQKQEMVPKTSLERVVGVERSEAI